MACAGNSVQPLPSDSSFSPLPIHLQNEEGNLGIWSPMTDLDVVQMSFRCCSDVVRITWDFQETSLFTVKMQTFRDERRLNNLLFSNQKRMFWQSLCWPRRQPTPQR